MISYESIRKAYYFGILMLVVYALPKIGIIKQYIYPMLNYEVISGLPIISLVSILTAIAAFTAYKYRKIG